MNAWATILLVIAGVVVSILVNVYLHSLVLDVYHRTNVEPLQEDFATLQGQMKELYSER